MVRTKQVVLLAILMASPASVQAGVIATFGNSVAFDFGIVPVNTDASASIEFAVDSGYRINGASGGGINSPYDFDFGSCGASGGFAGPGDCTINETFNSANFGPNSAALHLIECPISGGTCLTATVNLTATTVSVFGVVGNPTDFGNVALHDTNTLPIRFRLDAGYRVNGATGVGINPPFDLDFGSCGASGGFPGPGICTLNESFTPTVTGPTLGTLTLLECPVGGGECKRTSADLVGNGFVAPEPGGLALCGLGLIGWAIRRRYRHR